jgi:hypothetical protein
MDSPMDGAVALAPAGSIDATLVRCASEAAGALSYRDLTRDRLARIARNCGCDFATAMLYDRVRRHPEFAPFIDAVDARRAAPSASARGVGKVLVAPAAFFRELPKFGGDGAVVREAAERRGFAAEMLPTMSSGSVTENAAIIADRLSRESEPVIVVSISKGAADVRVALDALGERAHTVRAWVQICGIVHGSPIVDAILASRVRRTALAAYLKFLRADLSVCRELTWSENALLGARAVAPAGVEVVNVVGFPLAHHMRGNARRRHTQLQRFGPNDGSTLLVDAIVEPGVVYPVWGADHYFRVPEAPELLDALFGYFAETAR